MQVSEYVLIGMHGKLQCITIALDLSIDIIMIWISIQIIGSVVDFEGETVFSNNSVVDFGALQLLSFAQARLKRGSSTKFKGNRGK